MIRVRTDRCLTVLILAVIGRVAVAGEPNAMPIQLSFKMSPTPLGPYSVHHLPFGVANEGGSIAFAAVKPTYAADIVITGPTRFLPFPGRGTWDVFLREFAMQHAGLSEGQKALLLIVQDYFSRYPRLVRERVDPNHPEHLFLYAMTLDDAKKMAQAYYQFARAQFRQELEAEEGAIKRRAESIAGDEKRIPEVDKLAATAQKSWDDLRKTVPYRNQDEARNAIGELDRMLNAAQVDVAGIEARIAALKDYQGRVNPDVAPKLDGMMVDELVALRGAEARRQMATRLRAQANQFLDLQQELTRLTGEKRLLQGNLAVHQRDLKDLQNRLKSTQDEEPKIPAQVIIYPVQWADQTPAQNLTPRPGAVR